MYARIEYSEKLLFDTKPHEMTKNEKLYTKFRRRDSCIFGSEKCEESALECGGIVHIFGDEFMETEVKANRCSNGNFYINLENRITCKSCRVLMFK